MIYQIELHLIMFNHGFQEIERWASPNVSRLIVGNKIDRESERQVPYAAGKEFADELKIPFIETSAKSDTRVAEAFYELVKELLYKFNEDKDREETEAALRKPLLLGTQTPSQFFTSCTC